MKDSEIKLFGKKIALPETSKITSLVTSTSDEFSGDGIEIVDSVVSGCDKNCLQVTEVSRIEEVEEGGAEKVEAEDGVKGEELEEKGADKDHAQAEPNDTMPQDKPLPSIMEESTDPEVLPESDDKPKTPSIDDESGTPKAPNTDNDQSDITNSQQKTLKKPDKILPCPRCNSMDTKFCYYNNYNINQPRHFCKSCQRYWTAGGTMRNVPVGAGRRKNKNSVSHCHHVTVSEALQAARIDSPNGIHRSALKANGTVLSFSSDLPLCESMTSVLNPSKKKAPNGTQNGFCKINQVPVSGKGQENGDDCSSGSCVTTSNSMAEGGRSGTQQPVVQNIGFSSQIPCLPGVPWPCPWNSAVPVPAICPSGYAMPFFPAPYWNGCIPGAWSIPWLSPPSRSTGQMSPNLRPNSPTLGKHSRNGELLKPANSDGKESQEQKNSESSILIPKTLRIDDPEEAAKSSIWATLGIKNESINKGGFFKAFQPKSDEKNHMKTASPVLQANPAAMSRSLSFQETA